MAEMGGCPPYHPLSSSVLAGLLEFVPLFDNLFLSTITCAISIPCSLISVKSLMFTI